MLKSLSLYLVMVLLFPALFSGCSNGLDSPQNKRQGTITVTDFRAKQLNFVKPPVRIVCLIESALSGLYMLGPEVKVVGISTSVYDENVAEQYALLDDRIKTRTLRSPGNWDFVNIESLVALQPDLVIIWSSQEESIKAIESKGIPVYAVMLKSTADVYKELNDFGRLTCTELRADSLIQYTKKETAGFAEKHHGDEGVKKKIFFMWPQGPLETSGKHSMADELITMAGARNVCDSQDEHLVVNIENIIEWNPDVIVMWYNANKNPEDIIRLPEWGNIRAVKAKMVFELPTAFCCDLWTLKFQYAVKILNEWCYPDEYVNFDPLSEQQQMLVKLYGKKGGLLN